MLDPYSHDDRVVQVAINDIPMRTTVRKVREALHNNDLVEIADTTRLIISPYRSTSSGDVVYFNVVTPTEWWGKCSSTYRKVIYKPKLDKYILFDENDHMIGGY